MIELNPIVGVAIILVVIGTAALTGFLVGHGQGLLKGIGASNKVLEQFNNSEMLQTLAHGAVVNVKPELFAQSLDIIASMRNAANTFNAPDDIKQLLIELRNAVYNLKDPNTPPPPLDGDMIPNAQLKG